jgi:hypothetical protein
VILCTFGSREIGRCQAPVACLIQVPSGRIRPRCDEHATGGRRVTPEEEHVYRARRAGLDRKERVAL